jgi:hypothetical protein
MTSPGWGPSALMSSGSVWAAVAMRGSNCFERRLTFEGADDNG